METDEQGHPIIEDLSPYDDKTWIVQYQADYGYRWDEGSRWRHKSSARFAAEKLMNERGISSVRIVRVGLDIA